VVLGCKQSGCGDIKEGCVEYWENNQSRKYWSKVEVVEEMVQYQICSRISEEGGWGQRSWFIQVWHRMGFSL
jgi:hypothetical protein